MKAILRGPMSAFALTLIFAPACGEIPAEVVSENKIAPEDIAPRLDTPPEVDLSVNRRPCGEGTIATVEDDRGAFYAFCGFEGGQVGVLEVLPGDGVKSLVDSTSDPAALLDMVLPAQVARPDWLKDALRTGEVNPDHGTFEHQRAFQLAYTGSCSDPDGFIDWGLNTKNEAHYRTVAIFSGLHNSGWQIRDCVDENEFIGTNATWMQRTSRSYSPTTNGACMVGHTVRSCGGYTLMKVLGKETSAGSYAQRASYWIPNGSYGVLRLYSNSQRSCHPSRDRDHFRVTADASPGVVFHYVSTFVHKARDNNHCSISPD